MNPEIQTNSLRAKQARLAKLIGRNGYITLISLAGATELTVIICSLTGHHRLSYLLATFALSFFVPAIWWKRQLSVLPPTGKDLNSRLSADTLALIKPGTAQSPQAIWQAISSHWQAAFFSNHLLLSKDEIASQLSPDQTQLGPALQTAVQQADNNNSPLIEPGFIAAGLLSTSPGMKQLLTQLQSDPADLEALANWLGRNLDKTALQKRNFGGIGRDWAFGFTPLLNRFGSNLSQGIMAHGANFGWLTTSDGVKAIEAAFDSGTSAVALIGQDGIGKTSSVYALAQKLIEGQSSQRLAYHQIVGLNATDLLSAAQGPGQLEQLMLNLASEAQHAGHIILFLDDAQLFFSDAPGSFDGTQILLSIVQAKALPVIMAMSPSDHQRLKNRNQSLANLLTPVVLQELPEAGVMRVLEDSAVGLENQHKVLIAYEALREAYRLSGRYEQDLAYPGRAVKLLEQSIAHAQNSVVTTKSVQAAIEQTHGVKTGSAAPAEADALLHLEENIHQRMINQSHAVKVVSDALRRARAGVTNPKRPIGSFLFLGPTGVGKTELAKSIAATYFGDEQNMIRLDMSEYQQPDDVQRLLSSGQSESTSLLMSVRSQPFAVVLLDEIEKAHPNILNLLLQMLDEGQLTDQAGKAASFKDCVIIATSNAGANEIREKISRGETLESFSGQFTDELIKSGQFKPELLNRFDEMVLFRPLTPEELGQVVRLMMNEVNQTLANQKISVELTDAAVAAIVQRGNDPRLGARPMRRELQKTVEDTIAQKILKGEAKPGDHVTLDTSDLGTKSQN